MGEHLPCKQGVKSSNLSISINPRSVLNIHCLKREEMIQGANPIAKQFRMDLRLYMRPKVEMYLENRIQKLISRVKDRELIDVS